MIYIHAGYAKCASTTIQRFLWDNASFLREHDRIYPDLQTPEFRVSHHALPAELSRGPGEVWNRLRAAMDRRDPGQDILISSENFARTNPDILRAAFAPEIVRPIFYLKDLPRLIVSRYAHATKVGTNALDFDSFYEQTFAGDTIDFPNRLKKWSDVFGAENVTVRSLDPRVLVAGDVGPDILDAVGIAAASAHFGALESSRVRNAAPGWKTLEALRALPRNGLSADPTSFWEAVKHVEGPSGFDERGRYLTQEQFDRAADMFDVQVDEIRAMGLNARIAYTPRADFVARSFLPSAERVSPEELMAYFAQLCSALLFGRPDKKQRKAHRKRRESRD